MKNLFIFSIILTVALACTPMLSVDQETLDYMKFIINQPEAISWSESQYDDETLIVGFCQIYAQAYTTGDDFTCRNVLWAMGSTELLEFERFIIDALEEYPFVALSSLVALPSGSAIYKIAEFINDEDKMMRDHAASALGIFDDYEQFPVEAAATLRLLNDRLAIETEQLVIDSINWAISEIELQGPF